MYLVNRSARASVETISDRLYDVLVLHLEHSIDSFLQTLVYFAQSVYVKLEMSEDRADFRRFLRESVSRLKDPVTLAASFADGELIFAYREEEDGQLRAVERAPDCAPHDVSPMCGYATLWNLNNETLMEIEPPVMRAPLNPIEMPLYDGILRNRVPTFWLPHIWPVLGYIGAGLKFPFPADPAQPLRASILVDYPFSTVKDILKSTHEALRTSGVLLLVNMEGVPLASSSPTGEACGDLSDADRAVLMSLPKTNETRMMNEVELEKYGTTVVIHWCFYGEVHPKYRGTIGVDWRLFVLFPRNEFYAIIDHQTKVQFGLGFGCVATFVVGLAAMFRFFLTMPLQHLSRKLFALKDIISLQRRHPLEVKGFSLFAEMLSLHRSVMDVVEAAEKAGEQHDHGSHLTQGISHLMSNLVCSENHQICGFP